MVRRIFFLVLVLGVMGETGTAVAKARPVKAAGDPSAPASAALCRLVSVEWPQSRFPSDARYSFELYADGTRIATFPLEALESATRALQSMKDTGLCARTELSVRSELPVPF